MVAQHPDDLISEPTRVIGFLWGEVPYPPPQGHRLQRSLLRGKLRFRGTWLAKVPASLARVNRDCPIEAETGVLLRLLAGASEALPSES